LGPASRVRNITDKTEVLLYQIVLVIAVPADGAMTFARMLYFLPSMARVLVKPVMAAFAVEYCEKIRKTKLVNGMELHTFACPKFPSGPNT
jgi:hypothetical protein